MFDRTYLWLLTRGTNKLERALPPCLSGNFLWQGPTIIKTPQTGTGSPHLEFRAFFDTPPPNFIFQSSRFSLSKFSSSYSSVFRVVADLANSGLLASHYCLGLKIPWLFACNEAADDIFSVGCRQIYSFVLLYFAAQDCALRYIELEVFSHNVNVASDQENILSARIKKKAYIIWIVLIQCLTYVRYGGVKVVIWISLG